MAEMGKYCKAYLAKQFREYPGWSEQKENVRKEKKEVDGKEVDVERVLDDESILYLQENYVVTDGILRTRTSSSTTSRMSGRITATTRWPSRSRTTSRSTSRRRRAPRRTARPRQAAPTPSFTARRASPPGGLETLLRQGFSLPSASRTIPAYAARPSRPRHRDFLR